MSAEQGHVWTAAEVFALGVRTDVPTAGAILAGWGPSESYKAVSRGDFPVPVISVGRRLVVPVAPIAQLARPRSAPAAGKPSAAKVQGIQQECQRQGQPAVGERGDRGSLR